jgi:hypothetical protein
VEGQKNMWQVAETVSRTASVIAVTFFEGLSTFYFIALLNFVVVTNRKGILQNIYVLLT